MVGRRKIKWELFWLNNFTFFSFRERRKGNKIVMSDPNKLRLCKSISVMQTHVHHCEHSTIICHLMSFKKPHYPGP